MGRPSIDPELMIRMLVVGYVFAIRSERLICREVQVNLAYRWFCKLGIEDAFRRTLEHAAGHIGGDERVDLTRLQQDAEVGALRGDRHHYFGRVGLGHEVNRVHREVDATWLSWSRG
jgi:hypothetical protein